MTITDIVIAVAVILFLGVYVSWRAGRLDRMHTRLEAARAALGGNPVRRRSGVVGPAAPGFLDPAISVLLADAAHEARGGQDTDLGDRELARIELTQSN